MRALLDCKKAGTVCDKAQYEEAGIWEKFTMKVHHLICKLCRDHSVRNTRLTKLIEEAELKSLSEQEKERIKDRLKKDISG